MKHVRITFISNLPFSVPVVHLRLHTIGTMLLRSMRNPRGGWLDSPVWITERTCTITASLLDLLSSQTCPTHEDRKHINPLFRWQCFFGLCNRSFCTSHYHNPLHQRLPQSPMSIYSLVPTPTVIFRDVFQGTHEGKIASHWCSVKEK